MGDMIATGAKAMENADDCCYSAPCRTNYEGMFRAALRSVKPEDISDEMVRAFRRVEHEACCTGAALDDICNIPPIVESERRAIAAAIAKGGEQ